MKVQRSTMYAHFRKAVRFVSVAAVLTSFALGAACARKPGDNSVPVGQVNGELMMEMKLKESFPEFDWKAKQNKELAAKLQGASLRLEPAESKEEGVTRVHADLLVQLADQAELLHAREVISSGKAVPMEMALGSDTAYNIDARCMDKTCDIVAALVTETTPIEASGLTRTSDLVIFEDEEPLAEAPAILAAAGIAPAQPATTEKKQDQKSETTQALKSETSPNNEEDLPASTASKTQEAESASNVEESSDASKNASAETKQGDAQPAAPAKEPAKVEDKNKIVRRAAIVFRKRQIDPTMKPEAAKALVEAEGNMELIFSSSPNDDFKAGKTKVGAKPKAPSVTGAPAGPQNPADANASTGAPAGGEMTEEKLQEIANQPPVNTPKETENLK